MTRREFMATAKLYKVRVLFYKAKWFDGHIIDNAIATYTGLFNWGMPPYSHCEIWVPQIVYPSHCPEESYYAFTVDEYQALIVGTTYTSTMRGDNNGVVKRPASEVLKHPGRWDVYEVEVTATEYKHLMADMDSDVAVGRRYGKPAIAKFFNPITSMRVIKPEHPICSGKTQIWLYRNIAKFRSLGKRLRSPVRLAKRFDKMGIERNSL